MGPESTTADGARLRLVHSRATGTRRGAAAPTHAPGIPPLCVRDAVKRYGAVRALAGVSFDMAPGEWVALIGPNGAGKTTLMQALAGLVPLDEGRIELFGKALGSRHDAEARSAVGLVPQEIALYPALTVEENLDVFARLHGVPRGALRDRLAWALDWTGLRDRARQPVSDLSGGMKRRLNIACGVLHRPRVVLLDEPTVGVDRQGRRRIWGMLETLRTEGASLVQSTHELHEIESLCDRSLIVDRGRIIARGTIDELVSQTPLRRRSFTVSLDGPAGALGLDGSFETRGSTVRGCAGDLERDLALVIERSRAAGLRVIDLHVERPGLDAVFEHLTGRELRE